MQLEAPLPSRERGWGEGAAGAIRCKFSLGARCCPRQALTAARYRTLTPGPSPTGRGEQSVQLEALSRVERGAERAARSPLLRGEGSKACSSKPLSPRERGWGEGAAGAIRCKFSLGARCCPRQALTATRYRTLTPGPSPTGRGEQSVQLEAPLPLRERGWGEGPAGAIRCKFSLGARCCPRQALTAARYRTLTPGPSPEGRGEQERAARSPSPLAGEGLGRGGGRSDPLQVFTRRSLLPAASADHHAIPNPHPRPLSHGERGAKRAA